MDFEGAGKFGGGGEVGMAGIGKSGVGGECDLTGGISSCDVRVRARVGVAVDDCVTSGNSRVDDRTGVTSRLK